MEKLPALTTRSPRNPSVPPSAPQMTAAPDGSPQDRQFPDRKPYDGLSEARRLLRMTRAGALATIDSAGRPFASLVNVATDFDGAPLLLLSRLAGHTRFLEQRPHCSLLLTQSGKGDPLAHPRLTVMGAAYRDVAPRIRARFLSRHPKSALYADFPDFSFWRLAPDAFHLNGGFARAADFSAQDALTDLTGADALLALEASALAHLNADHIDALRHFATIGSRSAAPDAGTKDSDELIDETETNTKRWIATGLDPDGLDLMSGIKTARLTFPDRILNGEQLRRQLALTAKQARERAAAKRLKESDR